MPENFLATIRAESSAKMQDKMNWYFDQFSRVAFDMPGDCVDGSECAEAARGARMMLRFLLPEVVLFDAFQWGRIEVPSDVVSALLAGLAARAVA